MRLGRWANRSRGLRQTLVMLACATGWLGFADSASASRGLRLGFSEPSYTSYREARRDRAFNLSAEAGADVARINLLWRSVVTGIPANPRNPSDPAYRFALIDNAVQQAVTHGMIPMLTIYEAPAYAEGPDRPSNAPAGTWRPQPSALADFATAVATRYSGSFSNLPRVTYYQAWNEPNIPTFLTPQYVGTQSTSPAIYRDMLNAFYDAVKAVDPAYKVITGGTAPYGDPPAQDQQRTRPLKFLRSVLCLQNRKRLKPTPCPVKAKFDILDHHPISTKVSPTTSAINRDDATVPDFKNVVAILRAAEKRKTAGTPGKHPAWASEIWWDSKPPDDVEGVRLKIQARYLERAFYLLWKQGAAVVINLQVQDLPFVSASPYLHNTTGVFFVDGTPKPSMTAFRFPFVTDRLSARRFVAWGISPAKGKVAIEIKSRGGWNRVKSLRVGADRVFKTSLKLRGTQRLRARVAGQKSLVWVQR